MKKIIRLGAKRCQLVDVTVDDKPAVLVRVLGHSGDRDAIALNTTVKEMIEGNPVDCGYWMFDDTTLIFSSFLDYWNEIYGTKI